MIRRPILFIHALILCFFLVPRGIAEDESVQVQTEAEEPELTKEELQDQLLMLRAERDLLQTTVERLRAELKVIKDEKGITEKEKQARRAAQRMAAKLEESQEEAALTRRRGAKAVRETEATLEVWRRRAFVVRRIANERGALIDDLRGQIAALEIRLQANEEVVAALNGIRGAINRNARATKSIARELGDLNWSIRVSSY